ncbi:MAG: alpha-keto acid decarboxylase family protein [Chlamydiae bacterium]|nr:alpha-keto acid decarboxylase family protein [Chlamydiota bacterium]MBI3277105.1 alpha-keto acid decarboxylase family protein [Chlamydiota bacterium]
MKKHISMGQYLLKRLYELGIRHIFGIPGDYILRFYSLIEKSKIIPVVTTREDSAGFAADAYARLNGLGALCVTYCVGGLNVANPIAGAYAEKSPVVVISGAPGMKEREKNPLLHHRVREFTTQKDIFDHLTVASTVLSHPLTAFQEIDRVLDTALRYKRPVYIELPRDMTDVVSPYHHQSSRVKELSRPEALRESLDEAVKMINGSKNPVILADVEVHRFGLQNELIRLVERTGIPVASTALGKSVISEVHPLYLGVYEGAIGREEVRYAVESSDCLIMLGAFLTDINLGIFTARLDPARSIYATSEKILIRYHRFEEVTFDDFMKGLVRAKIQKRKTPRINEKLSEEIKFKVRPNELVCLKRLFQYLDTILDDNMVVIADIGDSLFGALDLTIHKRTEFLSPAYYTSMGFAVPAALGAQLAKSQLRPIVIVGDGAFQMTGLELSTMIRLKLNPIVLVLNNEGYGTERVIEQANHSYNDIVNWKYHEIPRILGRGKGFVVKKEGELVKALSLSLAEKENFSILNIQIDRQDHSPAMERIGKKMFKKI